MPKQRTLVHNWGINDAPYPVQHCPYYFVWKDMLRRAHSPKWYIDNPTYKGCTIDEQWKYFTVFKQWLIDNNWTKGMHIDKDLLIPGNMHYGPDTCLIVDPQVNTFFVSRQSDRGEYPIGVVKVTNNKTNPYAAKCRKKGKKYHIGYYPTEELAHTAYLEYKVKVGKELQAEQTDPKIIKLFDDFANNPMRYLK